MNAPKMIIKTLVYFLILIIRGTGSSHLDKIYSRLNNQDSKRGPEHSVEKHNYPLDKLMNRLGSNNSSRDSVSNLIDYNIDSRHYSNRRQSSTTPSSLFSESPNLSLTGNANALWKRRSVSGGSGSAATTATQRPRVTRDEFSKDPKRKKFAAVAGASAAAGVAVIGNNNNNHHHSNNNNHNNNNPNNNQHDRERNYERKAYEDSSSDAEESDDEEEDEPPEEEEDFREYQDLDPYSYDSVAVDHRNVRHRGSYTRFEQSGGPEHRTNQQQQQQQQQQLSPMTRKKWELLGSANKVDELFHASRKPGAPRQSISEDWVDPHWKKQAENHVLKIVQFGTCKIPKPKLIKVSDSYPTMSKTYFPSCTILHRCGDDTGCCHRPTQKCTAHNSTTVELYFTTTRVEVSGGNDVRVEKLTFINETECDCVEIMPRDMEMERLSLEQKPKTSTGCTCPSEFSARYMSNGSCICDCFDRQNDCIRYKRGLKYFDHQDRLCIVEGRCEKPLCRFGVYEHKYGRCPKRREKFLKHHY